VLLRALGAVLVGIGGEGLGAFGTAWVGSRSELLWALRTPGNNLIKTDNVVYPQSNDDKAPKNIFWVYFAALVVLENHISLQSN
jgi:hypothetical protein